MHKVVTRFAPSPTGLMHVGGLRTALFAWMYARKHRGTFILRIEDTDKEREVPGSTEHIIAALRWLGINWDEGVEIEGPHRPYLQSLRLNLYRKYAQKLIERGFAYADPYSELELETLRAKAAEEKRPFLFREHRPERAEVWDGTKPLRFKVPKIKRYVWNDIVRGELSAGEEALDDFILIKSDGYPTYNFAHIIDDIEMNVTHVLRGEEFISSTPKFLSLYDALRVAPPQFATMPVILGPDGNKKLSKRDGAKDILEYRAEGYLPEAMCNFLALLGWHPGEGSEVMTIHELIGAFDLSRVQKAGARFDEEKLLWMNHEHSKKLPDPVFAGRLIAFLNERGEKAPEYTPKAAGILKERARTFREAAQLLYDGECSFLEPEISYEEELLLRGAEAPPRDIARHLSDAAHILGEISDADWNTKYIKEALMPYAQKEGKGRVLWPVRVALSGKEKSPDPFTIAGILGKKKTLERIAYARQKL